MVARKPKVLVVDDDRAHADSIRQVLCERGFDARAAYDGLQGLHAIDAFHPHVLIVDMMMPFLSGFQVLSELRAQHQHLHIVFMTQSPVERYHDYARELGAEVFLHKPFSLERVLEVVRGLLEEKK